MNKYEYAKVETKANMTVTRPRLSDSLLTRAYKY